MSKKIKIFAIIILALAALLWVSSMFGKKDATPAPTGSLVSSGGTTAPVTTSNPAVSSGGEFASLLTSVRDISSNIDLSIFSNPAYRALRDHPITLGSDVIGRSNPFAPVGTDGADLSASPTVQTLQPGKVTSTTAELSAQISFSTTAPVSVVFQYGTSDQFGSVTTPISLTKSGTVVMTISNLASNTPYYVQAIAVVGSTTTNGNTMSFTTTTPPKKP